MRISRRRKFGDAIQNNVTANVERQGTDCHLARKIVQYSLWPKEVILYSRKIESEIV